MSERPYHKAMSFDAAIGLLRQESGKALDPRVVADVHRHVSGARRRSRSEPGAVAQADARRRRTRRRAQPAVGLVDRIARRARTSSRTSRSRTARSTRSTRSRRRWAAASASSDTMALISSKLSNIVPFSCCALFLYNEETETLRCRFATGVEADIIQQLDDPQRPRTDRLGRAQPPAARQRAAERRLRGRRARRLTDDAAVGARLPAASSTSGSSARSRSTTPSRRSTPTTTAGCSIASPSRPRPSSTTRSCSSRRRKTR